MPYFENFTIIFWTRIVIDNMVCLDYCIYNKHLSGLDRDKYSMENSQQHYHNYALLTDSIGWLYTVVDAKHSY